MCTVTQYVAVGAHKQVDEVHVANSPYSGKHLLQIWCMGQLHNDGVSSDEKPHLALGIAHEYGHVWDLQWCPRGSFISSDAPRAANGQEADELSRLGLLAVAFGNGHMQIFSVPHPTSLAKAVGRDFPLFVKLTPVFDCSLLSGSLIWKLSWCSAYNCQYILTGCSDGTFAVWKLDDTPIEQQQVVVNTLPAVVRSYNEVSNTNINEGHTNAQHHEAATTPKKIPISKIPILHRAAHRCTSSVRWVAEYFDETIVEGLQNLFVTAGSSTIKIWELSSAHDTPVHSENVGKDPVVDMKWSGWNYPALLCGHDEGSFVHRLWSGKHLAFSFAATVWVNSIRDVCYVLNGMELKQRTR
jgi:WD40 repeat protein